MNRIGLATVLAAILVAGLPAAARPAEGTYPGRNGKIAFESDRQIGVINADGSGLRRLSRNQAEDVEPAWSPDGKEDRLRAR